MTISSDSNPFDAHERIDREMQKLQSELMQLCKEGKYDEAEKRAHDELSPLHEVWLQTLYQAFKDLRDHPNFYQPK